MEGSEMPKAPSKKRIEMFKKLLTLTYKSLHESDNELEKLVAMRLKLAAGALCWAHGCGCSAAEDFETMCLEMAQVWEGHAVNKYGKKIDVLKALATGKDR